jgi:hypothetical protein
VLGQDQISLEHLKQIVEYFGAVNRLLPWIEFPAIGLFGGFLDFILVDGPIEPTDRNAESFGLRSAALA